MDKEIHDFINSNEKVIAYFLISLSVIGLILAVYCTHLSSKIYLGQQKIDFLKKRKAELINEVLYLKSLKN